MRLFDKYLLPLRSPDEPAASEPAPEPVAAVEPTPEPAPEPTPEPAPAPAPVAQERTVPLKVMLERIGEESSKRQAEAEARRVAEERAASLEAIVQRMQAEPKPTADPAAPKPAAAIEPVRPKPVNQSEVDQAAARMLLARDLRNVSDNGLKEYGTKWADAVNALNALGANSEDFVSSVMEIDPTRTHEIMFEISQDPERAVSLVRMSPAKRIAEITRMVMAKAAAVEADPKPAAAKTEDPKPAVSRAPAPKPAIAPLAPAPEVDPTTAEGNDKMTDAQWEAWYKAKHYKRSA